MRFREILNALNVALWARPDSRYAVFTATQIQAAAIAPCRGTMNISNGTIMQDEIVLTAITSRVEPRATCIRCGT